MALAKSNYLEGKIIEHVLRNVSYTSPATVYAALFTSDPGEAGGGSEVAGGSYARQAVTFGAHSNGQVANSGAIAFTDMPSATVTHVGIYDASSGGNLLYYGALSSPIVAAATSSVAFPIGDLTVTET